MKRLFMLLLGASAAACTAIAPQDQAYRAGAAEDVSGCWVHAFGRTQFRPPLVTYTGPTEARVPLKRARSLIVGPRARLLGYAASDYHGESLVLPAGTHVSDLDAIGFHSKVDSFRLACVEANAGYPLDLK